MFRSYAQNFEDVMLWRALRHVDGGFYIDIGAQDPVSDSVSLGFYERNWRGVHVEPVATYASALRAARPDEIVLEVAVGNAPGLVTLYEIPGTGLSTLDRSIAERHRAAGFEWRERSVPCVGLSEILDRYAAAEIHWLKIDVEGSESSVLESWRPSKVRPWIVLIESTIPSSQMENRHAWEGILTGFGYKFAHFDGLNRFYVSRAHRELLDAFRSGPNVFDDFSLTGTSSARFCSLLNERVAAVQFERETMECKLAEIRERAAALETALAKTNAEHAVRLQVLSEEAAAKARDLHQASERERADFERKLVLAAQRERDLLGRLAESQKDALECRGLLTEREAGLRLLAASNVEHEKTFADLLRAEAEGFSRREREFVARMDEASRSAREREHGLAARLDEAQASIADREAQLRQLAKSASEREQAISERCRLLSEESNRREREFTARLDVAYRTAEERERVHAVRWEERQKVHAARLDTVTEAARKRENSLAGHLAELEEEVTQLIRSISLRKEDAPGTGGRRSALVEPASDPMFQRTENFRSLGVLARDLVRQMISEVDARRRGLQCQIAQLGSMVEFMKAGLSRQQSALAATVRGMAEQIERMGALQKEGEATAGKAVERIRELEWLVFQIHRSRSWRLTSPLRTVARMARIGTAFTRTRAKGIAVRARYLVRGRLPALNGRDDSIPLSRRIPDRGIAKGEAPAALTDHGLIGPDSTVVSTDVRAVLAPDLTRDVRENFSVGNMPPTLTVKEELPVVDPDVAPSGKESILAAESPSEIRTSHPLENIPADAPIAARPIESGDSQEQGDLAGMLLRETGKWIPARDAIV